MYTSKDHWIVIQSITTSTWTQHVSNDILEGIDYIIKLSNFFVADIFTFSSCCKNYNPAGKNPLYSNSLVRQNTRDSWRPLHTCMMAGKATRVSFTINCHPSWKHTIADLLSIYRTWKEMHIYFSGHWFASCTSNRDVPIMLKILPIMPHCSKFLPIMLKSCSTCMPQFPCFANKFVVLCYGYIASSWSTDFKSLLVKNRKDWYTLKTVSCLLTVLLGYIISFCDIQARNCSMAQEFCLLCLHYAWCFRAPNMLKVMPSISASL